MEYFTLFFTTVRDFKFNPTSFTRERILVPCVKSLNHRLLFSDDLKKASRKPKYYKEQGKHFHLIDSKWLAAHEMLRVTHQPFLSDRHPRRGDKAVLSKDSKNAGTSQMMMN